MARKHINSLPNELLKVIFKCLLETEARSLCPCVWVCTRWNRIILESASLRICLSAIYKDEPVARRMSKPLLGSTRLVAVSPFGVYTASAQRRFVEVFTVPSLEPVNLAFSIGEHLGAEGIGTLVAHGNQVYAAGSSKGFVYQWSGHFKTEDIDPGLISYRNPAAVGQVGDFLAPGKALDMCVGGGLVVTTYRLCLSTWDPQTQSFSTVSRGAKAKVASDHRPIAAIGDTFAVGTGRHPIELWKVADGRLNFIRQCRLPVGLNLQALTRGSSALAFMTTEKGRVFTLNVITYEFDVSSVRGVETAALGSEVHGIYVLFGRILLVTTQGFLAFNRSDNPDLVKFGHSSEGSFPQGATAIHSNGCVAVWIGKEGIERLFLWPTFGLS